MNQILPFSSAPQALPLDREAPAPQRPARIRECPICLGPHEEEIHGATLRVHRWFRWEVTRGWNRIALV